MSINNIFSGSFYYIPRLLFLSGFPWFMHVDKMRLLSLLVFVQCCCTEAFVLFQNQFDQPFNQAEMFPGQWPWTVKSGSVKQHPTANSGVELASNTEICTCDEFAFQYGQLDLFMEFNVHTSVSVYLEDSQTKNRIIIIERADIDRPTFSCAILGNAGFSKRAELTSWPHGMIYYWVFFM